jgi:hypothetical protein
LECWSVGTEKEEVLFGLSPYSITPSLQCSNEVESVILILSMNL